MYNTLRFPPNIRETQEIEAFNQEMAAEVNAVSDLVDQQFPETDMEVIDYNHISRSSRQSRPKNR